MMRSWTLLALVFVLALAVPASAKHFYSASEFKGKSNFQFLTRFCFEKTGHLQFILTYPKVQCCARLLFYYNNPSQWATVKEESGRSCMQRQSVAVQAGNYLTLSREAYDGCTEIDVGGVTFIQCRGEIDFRSTWHEWWFFVISSCGQDRVTLVNYNFTMHNSPGLFTLEFSADEFGILETDIAFLLLYAVLFAQSVAVAKVLRFRRLLHPSYMIFMTSVFLTFVTLVFQTAHYGLYSRDGVGVPRLKNVGDFLQFLEFSLFLILLLLLAKGWTVTRAKLRDQSVYRLLAFFVLYFVVAMVMYIWFLSADIEKEVLYIYASPPGYGLVGVYFVVFFWFCYAIAFSVKNCESRQFFFKIFWVLYAPWFLLTPVSILILAQVVEDYNRQKIVNGITWAIAAYGHLVFAVMTFPAHFSQFFPYHIRTTQIDTLNDPEHPAGAYAAEPSDQVAIPRNEHVVNNVMPARAKRRSLQTKLFVQDTTEPEHETTAVDDDGSDSSIHLDRVKHGGHSEDPPPPGEQPDLGLDGDLGYGLQDGSNSSRRNLFQHTGLWVTETGLAEPAVVATTRSGKWGRTATTETYLEEVGAHIEMDFLSSVGTSHGDVASDVTASSKPPRSGRSSSKVSWTTGGTATSSASSSRATSSLPKVTTTAENAAVASASSAGSSRAVPSSVHDLAEDSAAAAATTTANTSATGEDKRHAWAAAKRRSLFTTSLHDPAAVSSAAGDDSARSASTAGDGRSDGKKSKRSKRNKKKSSSTKQTGTAADTGADSSPQRHSIFSPRQP